MKHTKRITADTAADLTRQCREAAGLPTTYRAAKATGVSQGTQSKVETGRTEPTVGWLRGYLERLGYRLRLVAERKP